LGLFICQSLVLLSKPVFMCKVHCWIALNRIN
jgi:hypothetical protein